MSSIPYNPSYNILLEGKPLRASHDQVTVLIIYNQAQVILNHD
jgi:hypothetical protein